MFVIELGTKINTFHKKYKKITLLMGLCRKDEHRQRYGRVMTHYCMCGWFYMSVQASSSHYCDATW